MNDIIKQFKLPKYIKGKTFAEASKLINDKFKDRNDNISKNTKNELLKRLAEAQEYLKAEQQAQLAQAMEANSTEVPDMMEGQVPQGMDQFMSQEQNIPQEQPQFRYGGTLLQNKMYNGGDTNQMAFGGLFTASPERQEMQANRKYYKNLFKEGSITRDQFRGYKQDLRQDFRSGISNGLLNSNSPFTSTSKLGLENYNQRMNPNLFIPQNQHFLGGNSDGAQFDIDTPFQPGNTDFNSMSGNTGGMSGNTGGMSGGAMGVIGSVVGSIGSIIAPGGTYGKQQKKNEEIEFYDEKLAKDQMREQGLGKLQDGVASAFGPVGMAVRGGQKFGKSIGDAIGGESGQAVSSVFDPLTSMTSNLTNKDLNIGEKALGVLPGFSGAISGRAAKRRQKKFEREKRMGEYFNKYVAPTQNFDNVNVNALGGDLTDPEKKKLPIATRQDSLNLRNSTKAQIDALNKEGYTQTKYTKGFDPNYTKRALQEVKNNNKAGIVKHIIRNNVNLKEVPNLSEYRQDINDYQFKQRDNANHVVNMDLPMGYYDERISPKGSYTFYREKDQDYVNVSDYGFSELDKKPSTKKQVPKPIVASKSEPVIKKRTPLRIPNVEVPYVTDTLSKQNLGITKLQSDAIKDKKFNKLAYGGNVNKYGGGGETDDSSPYWEVNVMNSIQDLMKTPSITPNIPGNNGSSVPNSSTNNYLVSDEKLSTKAPNFYQNHFRNQLANSYLNDGNLNLPDNKVKTFAHDPNYKYRLSNMSENEDIDDKKKFKLGKPDLSFLRYAPIAMDAFQLATMGKPEVEKLDRLNNKYQKQYLDEAAYQNIARQQAAATSNAIGRSGVSTGQLINANLASQLNATKAISDSYNKMKLHNISEEKTRQQIEMDNAKTNIAQSNLEKDINARNKGAYKTERSKLLSSLGTNIGSVGKEELYKKYPKMMGLDYDWNGEYFVNKKTGEKKSLEEAEKIENESNKKAKGGYLSKSSLNYLRKK